MTTANTIPSAAVQQLAVQQSIGQRLDAIDGALLGLLPRNERVAMVAQVEARIRELAAASPAVEGFLTGGTMSLPTGPHAFAAASGTTILSAVQKRSRLAVAAGVLGIVAVVLMLATPVTYFLVEMLGEVLGEVVSIALLGTQMTLVTLGGLAAVILAIAALVRLKRRKECLTGHGWAITGLCTGPLPVFAGGVAALVLGLEFLGSQTITVQTATTDDPVAAESPATAFGSPPDISSYPSTLPASPRFVDRLETARQPAPVANVELPPVEPAGHSVPVAAGAPDAATRVPDPTGPGSVSGASPSAVPPARAPEPPVGPEPDDAPESSALP